MASVLMSVWFAVCAVTQVTPAQNAMLKLLEGTWAIDNARDAEAEIVVTVSRDAKGVILVKATYGGSDFLTRYDPSGNDIGNSAAGAREQATFRSHVIGQKLVTEIWDGKPTRPPDRIETRWLESSNVMVTELARTLGGTPFNRVALRRKERSPLPGNES